LGRRTNHIYPKGPGICGAVFVSIGSRLKDRNGMANKAYNIRERSDES